MGRPGRRRGRPLGFPAVQRRNLEGEDVRHATVGQLSLTYWLHQALAAHQAVVPPSRVDPSITEAVERQSRAMRALSRQAFPQPETAADNQPAPIEQARTEHRRQADVSHAAALRRARAERAAREAGTPAAAAQPAPLGKDRVT